MYSLDKELHSLVFPHKLLDNMVKKTLKSFKIA
jgi:hypothetical protein